MLLIHFWHNHPCRYKVIYSVDSKTELNVHGCFWEPIGQRKYKFITISCNINSIVDTNLKTTTLFWHDEKDSKDRINKNIYLWEKQLNRVTKFIWLEAWLVTNR